MNEKIIIKGAHHNNLRHLDLEIKLNELTVITGVSGSGKSSLAFDTLYAEGQRRYVETFSPYARQFLDRMDKPAVEGIEGMPPAIAIDQTNPVRTSRSTVGTMTELNDHIKLLYARAAKLYCRSCGSRVQCDDAESIYTHLLAQLETKLPVVLITFSVPVPDNFSLEEIKKFLSQQGYERFHAERSDSLEVIQTRVRFSAANRDRITEALETAMQYGQGQVTVYCLDRDKRAGKPWRFSANFHCAQCDISYTYPVPSLFSFNSPIGACEACRGFGRTIAIDYNLVVPDESKSLAEGAIKPWQTKSYHDCQKELMAFARKRKVPTNIPWSELSQEHRDWVIAGEGDWEDGLWYGVQRFFDWLETKGYKMHIRVLLSKYRAYKPCQTCGGARLKDEALLWRLGHGEDADVVVARDQRFRPAFISLSSAAFRALPGLTVHDVMLLSLEQCQNFFSNLTLPAPLDEATELLLKEIRSRLHYLVEVGLGYLTLDRQSRTLSGGEVQRINLTTALGTALVNTLFVLDEPSIGLHSRDMQRVITIMRRLRDAGNALVVVEHDPEVMLAADRIIDMGPGPGERGGEIVFSGTPRALLKSRKSTTAPYLNGGKQVSIETRQRHVAEDDEHLIVRGACAHNLKNIDVAIPLWRMVCVTGVSGSGKSTLVQDVLYNGLRKLIGKPVEQAGEHDVIDGYESLTDVVLVDQSPIGKTTRSNPASYVGAWDAIRKLFASEALAKERGYSAGTFSFNSGNGRCPSCNGSGFEHVEMQFLSDVYLRCPDCNGCRYRDEVLDVKIYSRNGKKAISVADVLELTVAEAVTFFGDFPQVESGLRPLLDVGLNYLRLGQPVPTLSGGEAQRLKLAGHLAKSTGRQALSPTLFLFDEPTTGLHFQDIEKLLNAFFALRDRGHALLIIEHNLDVIRAADWVIELGPEGGEGGGQCINAGTPQKIVDDALGHTAKALKDYQYALEELGQTLLDAGGRKQNTKTAKNEIVIRHAREHNLRNVDVTLPRNKFSVITGVSGSGKSTVAFDILFAEGQRRYLESLNAYARQFVQPSGRPDVDAVAGIPPTVAIEQRTSRGGHKSTVATMTEIHHFLRLLFVKLGTQYCPECEAAIEPQSEDAIVAAITKKYKNKSVQLLAPLVIARKGYYTDLAAWALKKGFETLRVDGDYLSTQAWPRLDRYSEHTIELPVGDVAVSIKSEARLRELIRQCLGFGQGVVHLLPMNSRTRKTSRYEIEVYSSRRACPSCQRSFSELDPRLFSYNSKHGWCQSCYGTGLEIKDFDDEQSGEEERWIDEEEKSACSICEGKRLNEEARSVYFHDYSIADFSSLAVAEARTALLGLRLNKREAQVAHDIMNELSERLQFLQEVGLSYLQLDRAAPTLSGGEAQRLRLAAQLGSNLRGVCYILDEPTIGLHPRDNGMLLSTLKRLEAKGNTVIVVEHDEDTIRSADHVVDLGPGAGVQGGRVVVSGTVKQVMRNSESLTGRFLAQPLRHPLMQRRKTDKSSARILVNKADSHNLKSVDVEIPLERLVCVTGVSGSGKSTLIRHVLHRNLKALVGKPKTRAKKSYLGCQNIEGWQHLDRVLEVDQTPIGKTPRSCPATYIGIWDAIRKLFAATPEANIRGYAASRFSFNVKGGRCESCEGQGYQKIEMNFLPDVKVLCDVCNGHRFNHETLMVTYRGKNIAQVLNMSIDDAVEFFSAHSKIHHAVQLLQDVGLGYLTLGQASPTLSGGEAQRIKLVAELSKAYSLKVQTKRTLYILDEPTIGLHMADVEKLIRTLHRLVDSGHSVILIEHNLDVIAEADWIIDIGPEGGDAGGKVVAQGLPETVAKRKRGSQTAKYLAGFLEERG